MKGKSKQTKSWQSSLQSENLGTQKNDLDTEMYLKDGIKHVYADGGISSVCYRKDGELIYSLKKLRNLYEQFSKKKFLADAEKVSKQDLSDLRKFISSSYELISIQQEYLELFYSKLEEQKCKIKILQENKSDDVIIQLRQSSIKTTRSVSDDLHEEKMCSDIITIEDQTICSSNILHKATTEKNISSIEIDSDDTTSSVKNIILPEKVITGKEEEERLSEDGKRIRLDEEHLSKEFLDPDTSIGSLENDVKKQYTDTNKKAVDKHLSIISAIQSGSRKAPKNGVKLYQVDEDGWKSVKHIYKPKVISSLKKFSDVRSHNKLKPNRFSSMKVENNSKKVVSYKKTYHEVSHGKRTSLEKKKTEIEVLSSKKNLALKMATKKVENKSQERKGPVIPRKNWAKELSKEALIKLIKEGKSPSNCKFRFTLISGLESKGQHQSRDTWAALLEVETKDISLVKRFNDSDVILLMIRESVCQKAIRNLKANISEIQVCDDVSLLTSFILARKNVVLEELLRLSKTFKNFIPLVEACRYIKKELNKEKLDYGSFTYLGKKMGEPARESKDFNNE